tara:strand:- start:1120 stop:1518 length:399 start_codon:yes stop_codon:yes gene_type:complete
MPLFFLIALFVLFSPVQGYAAGSFEPNTIDTFTEDDYTRLAGMLKLQEEIPAAEENCYRIKKDKTECRCDNKYLYDEYDGIVNDLAESHPDWMGKTLEYDFFSEGVTYNGVGNLESFRSFSDSLHILSCTHE